jgi:dTDP-4-amino-4,6-dideoxygalactose transaminase
LSARWHAGVYPPLALGAGGGPSFPFDQPGLALTHLGRGAVWLALAALELGPGSRLAMPAYHCGAEVEAARLAGVEILFYRVDARLAADRQDLAAVSARADATYLISHFGFPPPAPPAGARTIADVAHGLFSLDQTGRPLGAGADATVFCPRKSLGVPDGGALLLADRPATPLEGGPGGRAMARSMLALAAGRAALSGPRALRAAAAAAISASSRADAAARAGTLTETVIGEWDMDVADMRAAAARASRLTARVVARIAGDAVRERRRANYARLAAALGELCFEPFRQLSPGTAPLYLPVLTPDRPRALARLLEHGVRGLEIWPVPHPLLDRSTFRELEGPRAGLLALPVHQQLRPAHVDAIASAASRALND